eukprot:TRINITY_DN7371_c0_g1_i1.p1 TRINITY_DN7371_c0_g1~~TRINITY_DN7371_c0_g1_i1.p1  ORF type:complete len:224 (-),score=-0.66 TRINITY_DN7371_c0_g1_i1:59-730(-)
MSPAVIGICMEAYLIIWIIFAIGFTYGMVLGKLSSHPRQNRKNFDSSADDGGRKCSSSPLCSESRSDIVIMRFCSCLSFSQLWWRQDMKPDVPVSVFIMTLVCLLYYLAYSRGNFMSYPLIVVLGCCFIYFLLTLLDAHRIIDVYRGDVSALTKRKLGLLQRYVELFVLEDEPLAHSDNASARESWKFSDIQFQNDPSCTMRLLRYPFFRSNGIPMYLSLIHI